jgi:hypothetical protein
LRQYSVKIDMYVDDLARNKARESETRSAEPVAPLNDLAQLPISKTTDGLADDQNRFVLEGDYWSITFNRTTKRFKNTLGMRYIAYLIRNQGKEVYVLDLFYAINPPDQEAINKDLSTSSAEQLEEDGLSVSGLGDAGEAMTPEGLQHIKADLKRLQERIDEAQEFGDVEKQAKLEDERDRSLSYLNSALGKGGRPRKASSPVEQIRKNVTNCIRRDIDKIESVLPELAHHLRGIKTGTCCQYAPQPKVDRLFKPR